MTRLLTPDLYGELALVIGILSILLVPIGSIQTLLTREIAKLDKTNEERKIIGIIKRYSKIGIFAGLAIGIILFFSSYFISRIFDDPQLILPIQIISVGIPVAFLLTILGSYYRGKEKIGILSATMVVDPLIKLLFAVGLVILGFGLLGATFSLWVGSLFAMLLLTPILWKKAKTLKFSLNLNKSFFLILSTSILMMLFLYLDLFFVKYYLGSEEAGYYNVAAMTSKVLYYAVGGIVLVFLPKCSKLNHEKDKKEIKSLLIKSILILIPFFIIFLIFPNLIITILYSAKYLPAIAPFQILTFGMLFFSIFQIFLNLMWSQNKEKFLLVLSFVTLLIDAFLLNYLVPIRGIEGAAIATTITSLFLLVPSVFAIKKFI
jgi:stage V sporulation protein B